MKQVLVSFNYDPETDAISDMKCMIDGIEKKKKTTRKAKEIVAEEGGQALMTLEPNKLVFNANSVLLMGLEYEDRIVIKYDKKDKVVFPIIGKDTSFDEEGTGNKVTKSNTVTYKGKANTILEEYGTEFAFEEYKEGIWKLISTTGGKPAETLEQVVAKAEKVEADLIVNTDVVTKIDEMTFEL